TRKSGLSRPPEEIAGVPQLPARFLEPHGFVWGSFAAPDGARLRWGHLPAANPRVECVMVGGFTECIEKYFETTADLAARGIPRPVARCITSAARVSGLGLCFVPGAGPWRPDRIPSPEISRTSSDPERCRLQYGWFSARAHLRVDQPTYAWLDASLRFVRRI